MRFVPFRHLTGTWSTLNLCSPTDSRGIASGTEGLNCPLEMALPCDEPPPALTVLFIALKFGGMSVKCPDWWHKAPAWCCLPAGAHLTPPSFKAVRVLLVWVCCGDGCSRLPQVLLPTGLSQHLEGNAWEVSLVFASLSSDPFFQQPHP